jgi:predicted MFS family arabinose efflux permease
LKADRLARTTLLTLCFANLLNFFDRQVLSALAPILKEYWQISDVQVGALATAFEITYALAPLPMAFLADRWLRSRVVALALVVWSAAMVLTGAASSYAMLLLGRASLGWGQGSYGAPALAWLSDLFPSERRSRVVSIHDVALMLGSAAGYGLGALLGVALGWRPVFLLAAIPGFVLVAIVWLLPAPPKGQSDYQALGLQPQPEDRTVLPFSQALRELLAVPTVLIAYAVSILLNVATAGLIYWLPSFLVRFHGFSVGQAGLLIGISTVVAGAAGVLSGGFLADRLLQRTPAARLLIMSVTFMIGFPFALAALFVPGPALSLGLAALTVYLYSFYFPCLAPLLHQVTRPVLRATGLGLGLLLIHILGSAPAPALVGWVSDKTGDLRYGLAGALSVSVLAGLIGLWGTRFVSGDTQQMVEQLAGQRVQDSA